MPRSYKGHKFIFCIIDEVMNYLITVQKHQSRSEEIADASIEDIISKYCVSDDIIMDKIVHSSPSLMNHIFKKLNIKIKTVVAYNHQLLQAEHHIKSLSTILNI